MPDTKTQGIEWAENPSTNGHYRDEIPTDILDGIRNHVVRHLETGGFLTACLKNDLAGAVCRADSWSLVAIKPIVMFLYNEIPSPCWGSPEKVRAWLEDVPE